MDNTKAELIDNVKRWISIDNELNELKQKAKELNARKKTITDTLTAVMKDNEIDCLDIKGGALLFKQNRVKKPINAKMLANLLHSFYKHDTTMAENVTNYILENREEQIKDSIKRKIDK
mgnify:CR=1 FL=1|tara:strand:- start:565 stop:921 length:357 start_codon:yes stop_codon:yes gene_type:complete